MKLTFAFILFYLMLSVLTFKLKKKIQKTKKGHWLWCINLNPKKVGESCCMMQIAIHLIV